MNARDAIAELRASFPAAGDALERPESILELQFASLATQPPLHRLPDAVRLAAAARLRSGEPIIPRDRVPVEPRHVAHLVRALARTLLVEGSPPFEDASDALVEAALPAATADDARGVHRAAEMLALPPDTAAALLREALKPELVRASAPFRGLVGETPRRRCPLCGDLPSCGTQAELATCCRWCGLVWRWDAGACAACGHGELRRQDVQDLVRGATFVQCSSCGEVVKLFACSPDPLVLSMHGVLAAPFDLAIRVGAGAQPHEAFPVF